MIRRRKVGLSVLTVLTVLAVFVITRPLLRLSSFGISSTLKKENGTILDWQMPRPTFGCALDANGHLDSFGNFSPVDPTCPWVDYVGILHKPDDSLTPEERLQKERLVGRRKRSILLIGDSQERFTTDHFCSTALGANLTVFQARWTMPNGSVYVTPHPSQFQACRVGQVTVASFFHYGFTNSSNNYIAKEHAPNNESKEIKDRIDNLLPKYLEDVFGKYYTMDFVVVHSGLWDLLGTFLSYKNTWQEELTTMNQTNSTWRLHANAVANSLEAQVPAPAAIIWRNLPNAHAKDWLAQPFNFESIKLMNEVGESFAESRKWQILDWRGPLLPLGKSALTGDGFHVEQKGRNLYVNRVLNAVMEHEKA